MADPPIPNPTDLTITPITTITPINTNPATTTNANPETMAEQQQQQQEPSVSPSPSPTLSMDYFSNKCSICFDAACEFCLDRCRDQFCRACFTRYVQELVKGGWGIAKVTVKCPACMDELLRHEWAKWVPDSLVATFDRNNQPFKALVRGCPTCQYEQPAATVMPRMTVESQAAAFEEIAQTLEELVSTLPATRVSPTSSQDVSSAVVLMEEEEEAQKEGNVSVLSEYRSLVSAFLRHQQPQSQQQHANSSISESESESENDEESQDEETQSVTITKLYRTVMTSILRQAALQAPIVTTFSKRRRIIVNDDNQPNLGQNESDENLALGALRLTDAQARLASQISARLLSMESNEEAWRELQFQHIQYFPRFTCTQCLQPFCFQCGEPQWHTGLDCVEWMALRVHQYRRSLTSETSGHAKKNGKKKASRKVLSGGASAAQWRSASEGCSPNFGGLSASNNYTVASSGVPHGRRMVPRISVDTTTTTNATTTTSIPLGLLTADEYANMAWKLENSKRCPRCCILINRDDGCNKVDCAMCSFRFCWICLSAWGTKCGFYRCQMAASESASTSVAASQDGTNATSAPMAIPRRAINSNRKMEDGELDDEGDLEEDEEDEDVVVFPLGPASVSSTTSHPDTNAMPELGVPNVARIHARFSQSI